jgi:hypothetical protein
MSLWDDVIIKNALRIIFIAIAAMAVMMMIGFSYGVVIGMLGV